MTTTAATLTGLTSRQRVSRALERSDHDRVPRHDGLWPETLRRWQSQGFVGKNSDFELWLGNDITRVCWSWPSPYPGRNDILQEDEETQLYIDRNGNTARKWKNRSGTPEHVAFGCDSREKWESIFKPALWSRPLHVDLDAVVRRNHDAEGRGQWTCLSGPESFETMRQLLGDEVTLMAMASEPDWVRDVSRTYTDLILRDYQAVVDTGAKPDGVWLYGDLAYNHGPFFSPAMYRELIWPDHLRIRKWARQHGMKLIYHTDGDVRTLVPMFIEGGFDCLQPLEAKANMDVRTLVPQYGDNLSFFGNIDMTVASTNDLEKIEAEVVSKLRAGMSKRGYLFHSDHSVPPQVDWATYQFIVELLNREGSY